uniref:Leucine-rich repeats and immunoglobulin-like domains 2 n=1 Tax=Oncorhynchus tshawytscha TaxID=74940 RepID=A0A8C8IVK7_ONCTS
MSIHLDSLSHMNLNVFFLNTSSLLCDCQLQWLGPWLTDNHFLQSVSAMCAHPASLLGRNILSVSLEELVCDDFPKPRITDHPETATALCGTNVTLSCLASSSSDSPMAMAWRKDWEVLYDAEVQNCARYQEGKLFFTTVLYLLNVNFTDEGCYQCVVSNHFGSNYSNRAKLTVNELPSFLKTPMDLTIRTGTIARLECAAEGHPSPQIAWQKDWGTDFPATEDMGVYSCTAQNAAGSMSANATLTVLGELHSYLPGICIADGSPAPRLNWTKDDGPLVLTERHFFAATNQLIIMDAGSADTGKYTCIMSNTLGTERGHIYLRVSPNCDTAGGYDQDSWNTVGIVVVCCVVGTSLVWVIVIYHMRRKSEDYSITNSDEMKLPVDIPSYLSSQGTLSERQEGYSNSEAGSHQQLMPPLSNGYLGPTLFSVYINDVALAAGDSLIHLYADDTILYTSGPSLDTVLSNLQTSFNAIQHSFRGLQLLLNASKTKCMLFNRSLPAPARLTSITTLDGSDLEYVDIYKYLGVWLDCKLSFQTHQTSPIENQIKNRLSIPQQSLLLTPPNLS